MSRPTRPTRPPAQQQEPSALDLGLKATRVQCGIANSLSYSAFLLPIHQREIRFQEFFYALRECNNAAIIKSPTDGLHVV